MSLLSNIDIEPSKDLRLKLTLKHISKMRGDPVTDEEWAELYHEFPNLVRDHVVKSGPADEDYNCIAWALGITDENIQPPESREAFVEMFESHGFEECDEDEADIDGFAISNGEITHASKEQDDDGWSSKLGAWIRITHIRDGLYEPGPLAYYGMPIVHFRRSRLTRPWTRSKTVQATLEGNGVWRYASALDESLKQLFPGYAKVFLGRYEEWRSTWFAPGMRANSRSSARATGPEWEAVLTLGRSTLPFIVGQLLSGKKQQFAVHLYEELQSDPSKKVTKDKVSVEDYHFLSKRVALNIDLYARDIMDTLSLIDEWKAHTERKKLSSGMRDHLDHPAYRALVQKGRPTVPVIMEQYGKEPDGHWHEMLYEIYYGKPSGATVFFKPDLFKHWKSRFEAALL